MWLERILKLAFLAVTSPLWFPVLRTLFQETQRALRPEGGLFARFYTSNELARQERRHGPAQDPSDGVTWEQQRALRRGSTRTAGGTARRGSSSARAQRARRRPGF